MLSRGELPAISRYLIETGSKQTAITAFPSTTGPAYLPFLTGCLPATCNVPGIRWLDKVRFAKSRIHTSRYRSYVGLETYLIGRDMRREIPTLFDLLPRSYNIFNSVNKGVRFSRNRTRLSRIWYWYYAHLTDRWSFVDKCAAEKLSRLLKKTFDMIFVILPGIDEYSHIAHYKNSETLEAYRRVDHVVDTIYRELTLRGMWNDTLLWVVSDHGLSETHAHFCLNEFLEKLGIRTFYYPKIFKRNCKAANMMSGNGMTHLYFEHDHGWQYPMYKGSIEKKYPGLTDELIYRDAVDVIAMRDEPHVVFTVTKRGEARIILEGSRIRYIVDGSDPFGYPEMNELTSTDELLRATINTEYPDAVYQLAHLFTSPRTGDVVISAAPGYDLRKDYEVPEHKGSHGSLHREHMLVPIICNAKLPDVFARTVDIFPTSLKLLDHPIPDNIDGKSLV